MYSNLGQKKRRTAKIKIKRVFLLVLLKLKTKPKPKKKKRERNLHKNTTRNTFFTRSVVVLQEIYEIIFQADQIRRCGSYPINKKHSLNLFSGFIKLIKVSFDCVEI